MTNAASPEKVPPEPSPDVQRALAVLREKQISCSPSPSGKAVTVRLQAEQTYKDVRELLDKQHLGVPLYLKETGITTHQPAKKSAEKRVEHTRGAKTLMQLLDAAQPRIWASLSPRDANTVLVDVSSFQAASKLKKSRPDLSSVRILTRAPEQE